jgi:hypothetical protein
MGCNAQDSKEKFPETITHQFLLGEISIGIRQTMHHPDDKIVFIQLHDNEESAVQSALEMIEAKGGSFITIENDKKRNIRFRLNGSRYEFDPNRIFTEAGREQTLRSEGNFSASAAKETGLFANFLLELIPPDAIIIAIHNNTNHRYAISEYRNERKNDAKEIFQNPEMDPDDFILTTDAEIFEKVKSANISVVLQDNTGAKDDGSLSYYFGKLGRTYINIEAQHGHSEQQSRMMGVVMDVIGEK